MPALLNEAMAAAYLGIEPKTLTRWRWASRGPKFVKVGALVRYTQTDLDAYVTGATVTP